MTKSIKELLEESRARKEAAKASAAKGLTLRGTGLTKRLVESSERAFKNQLHNESVRQVEAANPEYVHLPHVAATETHLIRDEWQDAAVSGCLKDQYSCIIGAAGTGKTTTVKRIVAAIQDQLGIIDLAHTKPNYEESDLGKNYGVSICFCAFTGRAVEQMKLRLPPEYHPLCRTIHAHLGFHPEYFEIAGVDGKPVSSRRFVPAFDETRKLPFKVYVIDEAGMCPIDLFKQLQAAMLEGSKVILVGDICQLPPVKGRSILGLGMTNWPTYELKTIHRQAADNPIIANAWKILSGKMPDKFPKQFDVVEACDSSSKTRQLVLNVVKKLASTNSFDPWQDALIVPTNINPALGQLILNEYLVQFFNGAATRQTIFAGSQYHFARGDKVMLLQNDNSLGVTNGMTGEIVDIKLNGQYRGKYSVMLKAGAHHEAVDDIDLSTLDMSRINSGQTLQEKDNEAKDENLRQASHIMTCLFGEKEVVFSTAGDYKKVTHAYANTCHKSQGGEYRNVVIVAHSCDSNMLNREWLYTAVTRAKERVVLITNSAGYFNALRRQRIVGNTLQEKIASFVKLELADVRQ